MLPTKEDKSVESFDVRVVEETGSTNDDMKTHARSSRVSRPLVLEAKHQTMGRGTRGRGWKSPEGCLAFSLLLPFSMIRVPVSLVAIAVGMGVCSALRDAGRFACIKWPNDVVLVGGDFGVGGSACGAAPELAGHAPCFANAAEARVRGVSRAVPHDENSPVGCSPKQDCLSTEYASRPQMSQVRLPLRSFRAPRRRSGARSSR